MVPQQLEVLVNVVVIDPDGRCVIVVVLFCRGLDIRQSGQASRGQSHIPRYLNYYSAEGVDEKDQNNDID